MEPDSPQLLQYQTGQVGPTQDTGYLTALAICHYVIGGMEILFSSCGLMYLFMGIMWIVNPAALAPQGQGAPPPAFMGWMFAVMGGGITLAGWTMGILTIVSGRFIHRQRKKTFSLVVAGINCVGFPLGTALGIFTFVLLARPAVRAMYARPVD